MDVTLHGDLTDRTEVGEVLASSSPGDYRFREVSARSAARVQGQTHCGGGVIASCGVLPGSERPDPSSRLMARTVMSRSQRI